MFQGLRHDCSRCLIHSHTHTQSVSQPVTSLECPHKKRRTGGVAGRSEMRRASEICGGPPSRLSRKVDVEKWLVWPREDGGVYSHARRLFCLVSAAHRRNYAEIFHSTKCFSPLLLLLFSFERIIRKRNGIIRF